MVILMAGVIFTEPDVDVDAYADADVDAEVMLSWEIRLLCALLKKVNKQWRQTTPEVRAISAAKTDLDADADADADAELSNSAILV